LKMHNSVGVHCKTNQLLVQLLHIVSHGVADVALVCRQVPLLKQRIAGKSLPVEKFAVKKSVRYFEQNYRLTLPAYVRNRVALLAFLLTIGMRSVSTTCLYTPSVYYVYLAVFYVVCFCHMQVMWVCHT